MRNYSLYALILLLSTCAIPQGTAAAGIPQQSDSGCGGEVYKVSEVTRKARIINRPSPAYTPDARRNRTSGMVSLIVVLCSSGKVTDVKVIQGLPHGLTESCVEAAQHIEFEPAERDGKPVSVKVLMEYNFDLY
jgi:TonB family protein